jgi:hypothetical protein
MNNSAGIPGGTENAVDSIEPLEPGRPDVIPNPPPARDDPEPNEGEIPLDPDDDAALEEDTSDVDANNQVSTEHPQSS